MTARRLLVIGLLAAAGCSAGDRPAWRMSDVHVQAPLTGHHASITCDDCHRGLPFADVIHTCGGCHRAAYDSSTFNHARFGVGPDADCGGCHTPAGWSPASFDHDSSGFPLTGKHVDVPCLSCHLNGVWGGQPTDCEGCHWTRHQDDPWSLALGTHCADCHTTAGWPGASFDHLARTGFALTGAHASLACTACHPNRQPHGTPADCNSCHASAAQNAGHPAFATDCASCHTTTAWSPSTFDHEPSFPIAQGRHSGFACTRCHTGVSFADFTCLTCHDQAGTDEAHREVPGYVYQSAACYQCHPTGTAGGAARR